jgi:hypothetical protein
MTIHLVCLNLDIALGEFARAHYLYVHGGHHQQLNRSKVFPHRSGRNSFLITHKVSRCGSPMRAGIIWSTDRDQPLLTFIWSNKKHWWTCGKSVRNLSNRKLDTFLGNRIVYLEMDIVIRLQSLCMLLIFFGTNTVLINYHLCLHQIHLISFLRYIARDNNQSWLHKSHWKYINR